MPDRWQSVDEIAEHLGIAPDTVYRWILRRNLPAHRIGRLWKFQIPEVDNWVRDGGAREDRVVTRHRGHTRQAGGKAEVTSVR